MKNILLLLAAVCLASCAGPGGGTDYGRPGVIDVVVVTGGHEFEHEPFFKLFQGHDDIRYDEFVLKNDSEVFEDISDWKYDVILLYNMTQNISVRRRDNFMKLLKEKGVGLVAVHHCQASFQTWDEYRRIIGAKYILEDHKVDGVLYKKGSVKHGEEMPIHVEDRAHPITRGLDDYKIIDETYKGVWFARDNHVLLTSSHPLSDRTVGWTRKYGPARVVFLQGGHDGKAYSNPAFRRVVAQSIRWAAGRL